MGTFCMREAVNITPCLLSFLSLLKVPILCLLRSVNIHAFVLRNCDKVGLVVKSTILKTIHTSRNFFNSSQYFLEATKELRLLLKTKICSAESNTLRCSIHLEHRSRDGKGLRIGQQWSPICRKLRTSPQYLGKG